MLVCTQNPEPDFPIVQIMDRVDQVLQTATEAVQLPHDKHVTFPQGLHACGQPRPVLFLSSGRVIVNEGSIRKLKSKSCAFFRN